MADCALYYAAPVSCIRLGQSIGFYLIPDRVRRFPRLAAVSQDSVGRGFSSHFPFPLAAP